jgi:hypothetical protein
MVHHIIPRTAKYLIFLAILVSGSYAPVVLMPRPLRLFFVLHTYLVYNTLVRLVVSVFGCGGK